MAYLGLTPTIYAAPTDQGTGDGSSEANAMDLVTALATATAGAIIGCLPGNYSQAYPGEAAPTWQITNDGTAGNLIIVVAKEMAALMSDPTTDENASRLQHTGSFGTGTGGPIVGCHSKSYQEWIGFVLDENNAPPATDMGTAELRSSENCAIRYCRIISLSTDAGFVNDNHSGVAVRDCTDVTVANNKISGYNHNLDTHNYNGVERYDTTRLTVEHNEIFDCANGIYFKDTPGVVGGIEEVCRLNYIHDCKYGIEIASTDSVGGGGDYYQNIIEDCSYGIAVANDTTGIVIYNNTLVCSNDDSGEGGPLVGHFCGADTQAYNNICVVKTGATVLNERYRTDDPWLTDYNRYYAVGGSYFYRHDSGNQDSLTNWQGAWTVDDNSTQGDPSFVDLSNGDYHLAGGSPSLTLSDVGGPIGAYITGSEEIGIRAESAADETPNAFAFNDVTDVALSTQQTSNTITVAGLGVTVDVTVDGGTYSKNGGAYTSDPGTADNGDQFSVRHTSSGSYSTAVDTTLTIGTGSGTFTSTTEAQPSFVVAAKIGGTAVDETGIVGTAFLDDETAVPAGAIIINGIAHDEDGLRYVCAWPGDGVVFHSGKIARRPDGAMCIATSGTVVAHAFGWALTYRGEVIVSTSSPQLQGGGFGVRNDGSLCVSEAA